MEGLNKEDKLTEVEIEKILSNHGHWIDDSDIEKYGLVVKEDDKGRPDSEYRCRDDGSCYGHTTYVHPKFGGDFHTVGNCKVQKVKSNN